MTATAPRSAPSLDSPPAKRSCKTEDLASCVSLRVKALEIASVFNPQDLASWRQDLSVGKQMSETERLLLDEYVTGYQFSGSHANRNIEIIYRKSVELGLTPSLENAVRACLEGPEHPQHVLVVSGFYVLHELAELKKPGLAAGSCETDGPLGALAVARTFAARGVRVSIFTDQHSIDVMKRAYEAMMSYFSNHVCESLASQLATNIHILPPVSDSEPNAHTNVIDVFPGEHNAQVREWQLRAVSVASSLNTCWNVAWESSAPKIDCLFALERLGLPYKNIRGRDISAHTEPIDCLWPLSEAHVSKAPGVGATERLRALAGVAADALTLGIGDGGNEVGMGKVAHYQNISELRPPGSDFVSLAENGCHRSCDHLLMGTVSNWAGSAFEMAAQVAFPLVAGHADYLRAMKDRGRNLGDLELHILEDIMRQPHRAVDGIHPDRVCSVDGMPFDPNHRGLYNHLWSIVFDGRPL